jgi:N,N'-diacetyllegionaminate synthase
VVNLVEIGGRTVGHGAPCFVIGEAGVNHDGDPERALALVDAAAEAGVDAVKFQTFDASRLVAVDAPKARYQLDGTDPQESQRTMLARLELDAPAHRALVARCAERGVVFLSTPFDAQSADLLEELGVPAFKLASPDLTNLPLIEHVARKGRPLLLSTGMAELDEVREAVATALGAGAPGVVVLHCVSAYPADPREANLRAITTLAEALGLPVGWSDHTLGEETALAAVALGAAVLEKHLTLDRTLPGPDHAASLEPDELARLVRAVRVVEAALGDGVKRPAPSEAENRRVVRRSLAAAYDLDAGTVVEAPMLLALRPGTGISPARLHDVVGRRLARPVRGGALLEPGDLS